MTDVGGIPKCIECGRFVPRDWDGAGVSYEGEYYDETLCVKHGGPSSFSDAYDWEEMGMSKEISFTKWQWLALQRAAGKEHGSSIDQVAIWPDGRAAASDGRALFCMAPKGSDGTWDCEPWVRVATADAELVSENLARGGEVTVRHSEVQHPGGTLALRDIPTPWFPPVAVTLRCLDGAQCGGGELFDPQLLAERLLDLYGLCDRVRIALHETPNPLKLTLEDESFFYTSLVMPCK